MEKRIFLCIIICLLVVSILPGCAATSSSTRTETITTQTAKDESAEWGNQGNFTEGESHPGEVEAGTTKMEKRVKVEEKHTESGSRGVLGTTFHFIGQVLAFPFKVIGKVIEFIF